MQKQTVYETLTPDEVDGRYAVIVRIRPELPQDRMVIAQLVQAYRTPGADGRPMIDDLTLLEEFVGADYPDTIRRRLDQQFLPAESPDVKKLQIAAAEQKWMDDHPDTIKKAEERIGEALRVYPDQLQAMIAMGVKMALGAQGAPQLLAQAETMAAGGQPMGAPGQGPVGVDPAAMPSQMMMTPEETLPNRDELAASQARRGKPAN